MDNFEAPFLLSDVIERTLKSELLIQIQVEKFFTQNRLM